MAFTGEGVETPVAKARLTPQDRLLLEHLSEDGRLSHRELARRSGLSLATVNRRIRQMEANGTIHAYRPVLDAESVGWGITVIVGLRITKGHLRHVQERISQDPRVFAVYDVTGEWDGMVLARCRDRADLDDLAKSTLSLAHIARTNTMVVLHTVAEDALVRLP